jgi:hypothetical protein
MLRKQIYKWHRRLSLLISLPVLVWAISGFMHPLMTTIRPSVATQFLVPTITDSSKLRMPLQAALQKNNIAQFHNVRLVHIDSNWFYQVQLLPNGIPQYLSTQTGRLLANGDRLYAQYIAKLFLEGPPPSTNNATAAPIATTVAALLPSANTGQHDCCDAATNCVLLNEKGSQVTAVSAITHFDEAYKNINRLLPVYKVSFNRADGIHIYVHTSSDRFAYAVDNKRAIFDTIFAWLHNWVWLDALGVAKYYIMALLLVLTIITTIAGLYIFFISNTKKANGNSLVAARRNHRWTAVPISLFTLMFAFSGAYHCIKKTTPDNRNDFYNQQQIQTNHANLNLQKLQQLVKQPIINFSAAQINQQLYWRIIVKATPGKQAATHNKDQMKDKMVEMPTTLLVHAANNDILPQGEQQFAQYLAGLFSKQPAGSSIGTTPITKFEGEYGFVNKRLPVWKVSYPVHNNERYYIETSTGSLAVRVDDTDLAEGYSFALMHKHHFMDWAGKAARDFSSMFWAAAQIAMVAIGLLLWRKSKQKNKKTMV